MSGRSRKFYASSPLRELRLRAGLTLQAVAIKAGISMARASEIERFPGGARPYEVTALENAIVLLKPPRVPEPEPNAEPTK